MVAFAAGMEKPARGFAAMSPEKRREVARLGGKAAHEKGTAYEWSVAEAQAAGRKGGQVRKNRTPKSEPT